MLCILVNFHCYNQNTSRGNLREQRLLISVQCYGEDLTALLLQKCEQKLVYSMENERQGKQEAALGRVGVSFRPPLVASPPNGSVAFQMVVPAGDQALKT